MNQGATPITRKYVREIGAKSWLGSGLDDIGFYCKLRLLNRNDSSFASHSAIRQG